MKAPYVAKWVRRGGSLEMGDFKVIWRREGGGCRHD